MAKHKLFDQFPIDGEVQIGEETLTTPYQIYDGSILFIGGRADASVAAELLRNESLSPILDQAGNALAAIWVCNFTDANLGPHHELQFSIFASYTPVAPVSAHPLAIYRLLSVEAKTMMVCHGLWNSTERVVRYNREHLMLDARLCESQVSVDAGSGAWRFNYADAESKTPLLAGNLNLATKQPGSLLWEMTRQVGLGGIFKTMREPAIHVPVVNTRSDVAQENLVAHTYTNNDKQIIQKWEHPGSLEIQHPGYRALNFSPDFVQQGYGVHFVYLRPVAP